MELYELRQMQALPLEAKLCKTQLRIREFVERFGEEGVYISFSGGKDSTVLLHIVRNLYPDVEAVFIDTGLEYPEVKQHVKTFDNVTILRPKMSFKQVIEKYGYPIISKEVSQKLYEVRTTKSEKLKNIRLNGTATGAGKLPHKWHYLINAPFKISNKCCRVMKKEPAHGFMVKTGKHPFIGTMTEESAIRLNTYLRTGCNSFDSKYPTSKPLSFWTEQDILQYILNNHLAIPSVYGNIITDEHGKLKTTGCSRTGCVFCGYGCHLEKCENRYQRLERTHPQLHDYCMNKLGFKQVLDYIGVETSGKGKIFMEDQINLFDKIDKR